MKGKSAIKHFCVMLFWLVLWQITSLCINKEILLPSPVRVFNDLLYLVFQDEFWLTVVYSTIKIIIGFVGAVIVGAFMAFITYKIKFIDMLFSPILHIIKATPVASFIILVLVWIPSKSVPSFVSFLMVTPVIWINLRNGFKNIDKSLIEMANVFGVSKLRKITKIIIPSIIPYFAAACNIGIGFAWKSSIAAEVIANTKMSIGSMIYQSKIYLETSQLFSWTIVVVLLSLLIEHLMDRLMKVLISKYDVSE